MTDTPAGGTARSSGVRVAVVGPSGAGKTVFANRLASLLAVAIVTMDALYWDADWRPAPEDIFVSRVRTALAGRSWVAEGVHRGQAADLLWASSDLVIWLDLPRALCVARTVRRTVGNVYHRRVLWGKNLESWRRLLNRQSVILACVRDYRPYQQDTAVRWSRAPADRVVRLCDRAAVTSWLTRCERGPTAEASADGVRSDKTR